MDLKGNGIEVHINARDQSDEWLLGAAAEIAFAAQRRGLELPNFAGTVAVEAAANTQVDPADVENVKESIVKQIGTAYSGYSNVVGLINTNRKKIEQVEIADLEPVVAEFIDWLTTEKAEQVARMMEADPELRFTLLATPNVIATAEETLNLAVAFGKQQPINTYIWSRIVESYTPEQLSGTHPDTGKSIQFSLMPNKFHAHLYGTVDQQRAALAKVQADIPDLRVPSFLEALTYWQTLRAQGDDLAHGAVFDITYIRHFDQPKQRFDCEDYVLDSYVDGYGKPEVDESNVRTGNGGRALLG